MHRQHIHQRTIRYMKIIEKYRMEKEPFQKEYLLNYLFYLGYFTSLISKFKIGVRRIPMLFSPYIIFLISEYNDYINLYKFLL
jgi:hypothetical protein